MNFPSLANSHNPSFDRIINQVLGITIFFKLIKKKKKVMEEEEKYTHLLLN